MKWCLIPGFTLRDAIVNLSAHLERSAPFALRLMWGCIIAGPTFWLISESLKDTNLTSSEIASWVQAFGSIGAILAAIWISGGDRRHKAMIERATRRDAIDRAIDASEHAKTCAIGCFHAFSQPRPLRSELIRPLAAVEQAAARIKEVSAGPGIDSQLLGHLYEVGHALADIKQLVEQYISGVNSMTIMQKGFIRQNAERIDKAEQGLLSMRV